MNYQTTLTFDEKLEGVLREETKEILLDQSDGPVTKFIVIHRALRLAAKYPTDHIANLFADVLYTILKEWKEDLPTNEGK